MIRLANFIRYFSFTAPQGRPVNVPQSYTNIIFVPHASPEGFKNIALSQECSQYARVTQDGIWMLFKCGGLSALQTGEPRRNPPKEHVKLHTKCNWDHHWPRGSEAATILSLDCFCRISLHVPPTPRRSRPHFWRPAKRTPSGSDCKITCAVRSAVFAGVWRCLVTTDDCRRPVVCASGVKQCLRWACWSLDEMLLKLVMSRDLDR